MKVILTGDFHIGSSTVSVDEIMRVKERYWLGKPVLLMGDLIDTGLDRGMEYDQKYNDTQQIKELKKILKDLDIRTCLIGNHEHRIFAHTGINIYSIMDLPEKHYIEIDGCSFYVTHGKSVAKNPLTEFTKLYEFVDTDVMGIGHSHDLGVWNKIRGGKRVMLCRTGSFLEGAVYAVDAAYPPKIKGWIEIDTKRKTGRTFSLINGKVMKI